ncbi:MAG: MFS transporter [Actinobacteria bacterium]|nr:MFS transporter [Actinomycetota bacterium]
MADATIILILQAIRALLFGFGSILLGALFKDAHFEGWQVGLVLTSLLIGNAAANAVVGFHAERIGRRRLYRILYLLLAVAGAAWGLATALPILAAAALCGVLSADVLESGPFTSLEQAMLAHVATKAERIRIFGVYNAVAAVAGSIGALLAGGPEFLGWPHADHRWFLAYVPLGMIAAALAGQLSAAVEAPKENLTGSEGKTNSTGAPDSAPQQTTTLTRRLCALFAFDAFGGGFVVQSFVAYWIGVRFNVGLEVLGPLFFGVGMLQGISFLVAVRLAHRFGLLNTMVFTHLPSNLMLAAIPFAPSLPWCVALLLGRHTLSQMDVPTRQAYLAALFPPRELAAVAAATNTARLAARPLAPLVAGALLQTAWPGAPFLVAGGLKIVYDLGLYALFRRVKIEG